MAFVPPMFAKFATSGKDLFKKKYDFDHVVKNVNKTKHGITLESGGNLTADFKGYLKTKYVDASFGEVEAEAWTCPKSESKATVKLTKLASGLTVTLGASTSDRDRVFTKSVASVDAQYKQEYFAGSVVAKTDLNATKLDATAAVGVEGVSVGGQVVLDVSKGADVVDSNIGFEYAKSDLTASVYTEKNADVVNGVFWHKLNKDTQVGAQLRVELTGKQSRSLTVGVEHVLNVDTVVKAKAELPSGLVATAVEQRLANPKVQVGVAAQFNTKVAAFTAEKYGVSLTFGDY